MKAPDKARLLVAPQGRGAWHRSSAQSPALLAQAPFLLCLSAGGSPLPVPPASFSILPALHTSPCRGDCRPERPRSSCIPILLHCRATPRPTLRHPRSLAQYQEAPHQGVGRSRHLESAGGGGDGVGGGLDRSRLQLGADDRSNPTLPQRALSLLLRVLGTLDGNSGRQALQLRE